MTAANGHTFVLLLAIIMFLLATIRIPEPPRLSYGWCGALLLTLSFLFTGAAS
jgi:hypothetical protein